MEFVDYFMEEVRRACTTPARRSLLEPDLLKTFPKASFIEGKHILLAANEGRASPSKKSK